MHSPCIYQFPYLWEHLTIAFLWSFFRYSRKVLLMLTINWFTRLLEFTSYVYDCGVIRLLSLYINIVLFLSTCKWQNSLVPFHFFDADKRFRASQRCTLLYIRLAGWLLKLRFWNSGTLISNRTDMVLIMDTQYLSTKVFSYPLACPCIFFS